MGKSTALENAYWQGYDAAQAGKPMINPWHSKPSTFRTRARAVEWDEGYWDASRIDPVEQHKKAVSIANHSTRVRYGVYSVPCEEGSEAHRFWLAAYDRHITI
jgi:hypothetical protein